MYKAAWAGVRISMVASCPSCARQALLERGLSDEEVERALRPVLSFRAQLEEEMEWYEKVRRRDLEIMDNLSAVGTLLIALRIANGLSQKDLAQKLDVCEAQVSRDERNEYHGITVERVQRILDAVSYVFPCSLRRTSASVPVFAHDLRGIRGTAARCAEPTPDLTGAGARIPVGVASNVSTRSHATVACTALVRTSLAHPAPNGAPGFALLSSS